MKRNTFTLIEILGVVVIIGLLAALGFAGYSYANSKARESATQGLITRLNAAFEFARQKSGFLPPAKDDFVTIKIDVDNKKITIDGKDYAYNANAKGKEKMRSEFYRNFVKSLEMDSMNRFMNGTEVIDSWGNAVYFRYPGVLNKGGFDLISAGSDNGFGTNTADKPSATLTDYRDGAEWICDDIANF